ncbi:MAG: acetamidase [Chloroflexota bacterium]|nr:MAG: acetamidase [Chloroflexota bacterium]
MAIHRFEPRRFHTTIGSHEPALRVGDGDTVITWCVDARGQDRAGAQITPRGNPQTGPFYVEGAAPGDALAVTFDRIYPNRAQGWTNCVVAPWVVDPDFVTELPKAELETWALDLERGLARLEREGSPASMASLPFDPMIGCFGVAPAGGQAISTATSAEHGGNMDYRGFRQGVTVYLPVAVEGALFHIGDGHAVQGDGEIVGTGIEVSFDVEFTPRVVRNRRVRWPRAENEREIMAIGNGRPLDQCVQHATTELMRMMQEEYGLTYRDSSAILGQCVRYDLGNVFDPAYTMVAKVEKRFLPPRRSA